MGGLHYLRCLYSGTGPIQFKELFVEPASEPARRVRFDPEPYLITVTMPRPSVIDGSLTCSAVHWRPRRAGPQLDSELERRFRVPIDVLPQNDETGERTLYGAHRSSIFTDLTSKQDGH